MEKIVKFLSKSEDREIRPKSLLTIVILLKRGTLYSRVILKLIATESKQLAN